MILQSETVMILSSVLARTDPNAEKNRLNINDQVRYPVRWGLHFQQRWEICRELKETSALVLLLRIDRQLI